jgi:hypothetical protein
LWLIHRYVVDQPRLAQPRRGGDTGRALELVDLLQGDSVNDIEIVEAGETGAQLVLLEISNSSTI